MTTDIFLSIIIPAHNEEFRLPASLAQIDEFLKTQPYTAEVIVVENGSHDRTAEVVRNFATTHPYVTLIEATTRGKGLAIRQGMLAARGEYRFFADADLSMPIAEVVKFIPPRLNHKGIAIGSREIAGAVRYNEPYYRHLMGRVFSTIVKWFALPGYEDTQCGFKCFHAEAAERIFRVQVLNGMSFDVEVLYIGKQMGYPIVEIPINWYFNAESRVRLVQDSLSMLLDIFTIRRNWRKGVYSTPP